TPPCRGPVGGPACADFWIVRYTAHNEQRKFGHVVGLENLTVVWPLKTDASIRIWNIDTGELMKVLEVHTAGISCLKVFHTADYHCPLVFTGGSDNMISCCLLSPSLDFPRLAR